MRKKHILLTFYDLGLGGIQTKLISLANKLIRDNFEVTLLLQKHVAHERIFLVDKKVKIIFPPDKLPNYFKSRYYFFILWTCLIAHINTVVLSLEDTAVFVLKWRKWLPFWSTKVVINYDLLPSAQQRLKNSELSAVLSRADIIIGVSQQVCLDLTKRLRIPASKVKHIPNWFDQSLHKRTSTKRSQSKIIFAGRFSEQKQPLEVIKIFESLKAKLSSLHCELYGDGPLKESLKKTIKKSSYASSIKLHEPTTAIAEKLQSATVLLLPSLYEGLPFIVLEAMAHGCIVALYNFPGATELVTDGADGVIATTPQGLAEKLQKILSSKLKTKLMSDAAARKQKEYFGNTTAEKFIKLL